MIRTSKHKLGNVLFVIPYVLLIVLASICVRSQYLWNDESFTFQIIKHSYSQIVHLTALDVHPFMYYFIAKFFSGFTSSLFGKIAILRLVSVAPFLLMLLFETFYLKKFFSSKTIIWSMFATVCAPLLVGNIYQVRMYGWASLFVFLLFSVVVRYIQTGKFTKSYAISTSMFSLLAAYSHYYGLIAAGILNAVLFTLILINNRTFLRRIFFSIAVDICLYFPWLFVLFKQTKTVSGNYWTPKMSIPYFVSLLSNSFRPFPSRWGSILALVLLLSIAILLFIAFTRFHNGYMIEASSLLAVAVLGISFPFIALVLGSCASLLLGHTVIIVRYLCIFILPFWFSVSILVGLRPIKVWSYLASFAMVLIFSISFVHTAGTLFSYGQQFHNTLKIYRKIPKNATVVFDNSVVMYSSASYISKVAVLSGRSNDVLFHVYKRVFKNIRQVQPNRVHSLSNQLYFVQSGTKAKKGLQIYQSRYSAYVSKKFKATKIDNIFLPLDGGKSTLYRLTVK